MDKKIKIIIILSCVILVLLLFIGIENFLGIKHISNLTKETDIIIKNQKNDNKQLKLNLDNRNKLIQEYKNKPIEEKVIIQEKIIEKDTELLNNCYKNNQELINQLDKTNETLKNINNKKNSLKMFGMIGLDQDFEIDLYLGILYDRKLFQGKKIDIVLGGGGAIKIYKEINNNNIKYGGSAILEFGFNF